jgi:hypothetical protein
VNTPRLVIALLVFGCNGRSCSGRVATDVATTDGTPSVSWIDAGTPDVAPPDIPWLDAGVDVALPVLTCREGWTATALASGATICEPWPTGTREVCASPTAMQLPGEAACAEVGADCPQGEWPADLPATGVWYVAPGATGDGTSADSPLGALAGAVEAAEAGDTIALAKGSYDGSVTISDDLTLRGACAAETTLTAVTIPETGSVLSLLGGTLVLRDLQITGAAGQGLSATGGTLEASGVAFLDNTGQNVALQDVTATISDALVAQGSARPSDGTLGYGISSIRGSLSLRDAALLQNTGLGLRLKDGDATIDNLLVAETQPRPADNQMGGGMELQGTAAATVAGLVVEDVYSHGVAALDQATFTLTDSVVRRVAPAADNGEEGYALKVFNDAEGEVEAAFFDQYGVAGVLVYADADDKVDETLTTALTDVVLQGGIRPDSASAGGYGVVVNGPRALVLSRVLSADNEGEAVAVEAGAHASITDLTASRSGLDGVVGAGVFVRDATVVLERAALVDNAGTSLYATEASSLTVSDLYIAAPSAAATSGNGAGIYASGVELLQLSRAVIEDVALLGIYAGRSTEVALTDIVVRRVAPDADDTLGVGLACFDVDAATIERLDVSEARLIGVDLVGVVEVNDLRVAATTSDASAGLLGVGVFVEQAAVSGSRWVVESSQNAGIAVSDSSLEVKDVLVDGVIPRSCSETTCLDDGGAAGVYVAADASLELEAFLVQNNDGVGVQSCGSAALTDGYIQLAAYGTEECGEGSIEAVRVDVSGADAAKPSEAQPVPSLDF